jgi:Fe-S cluster assembly scaffold protein SufB
VSVPPLSLPFLTEEAAQAASIAAGDPDWRLAQRVDAVARVASMPAETNQLFTPYLDLRAARFSEIDVPVVRRPLTDGTELPDGAALLVDVDGTTGARVTLGDEARAAGIIVEDLRSVAGGAHPRMAAMLAAGDTLPTDDPFAHVARAMSTLDLVIGVPPGVRLERPIVVRWHAGAAGTGSVGRTFIVLGPGASAKVLEEQLGDEPAPDPAGPQRLWWGTTEVILGDRASLEFAALQDFDPDVIAVVNRHATLGEDAQLRWALASLGAQLHRSRIDNRLVGRGSSVHQVEIGFGRGTQLFDLTSYTRHIGTDTTGDLLSKGVFTDRSRGYIKGLIEITRSATGTDSYLGEFGMLLTKRSRSVTIPSLEIDQPNVRRAAHSSSVGPIDEAQVFYLMSRGVDRDTARRMIVLGFLEPVVARIPLPDVQERLRALLEARWPSSEAVATAA